jgi:hypothetical protein
VKSSGRLLLWQQDMPLPYILENFDVLARIPFYKVLNPDLIAEVAGDLKKQLQLPPKSSRFIMNPHLTIAKS